MTISRPDTDIIPAILSGGAGDPIPGPIADRIRAAVTQSIATGTSIDVLLGTYVPPGHMYRVRNHHLREAAKLIEGDTPSAKVSALAVELKQFQSTHWVGWREKEHPPVGCSKLRGHIFAAFKAHPDLPTSTRQLRRIFIMDK